MRAIGMYIFGGSQTIGHLQSGWEVNTILEMTDTMLDKNAYHFHKNYPNIDIKLPKDYENNKEYLDSLRQQNYDLLFSNPPCSGLSSINRNANVNNPINNNIYKVTDMIDTIQPKTFLIENAPTLTTLGFSILKHVCKQLNDSYYILIINDLAGNHGVAMNRRRTLIVGFNKKYFKGVPIINNECISLTVKDVLNAVDYTYNKEFDSKVDTSLFMYYNQVLANHSLYNSLANNLNDLSIIDSNTARSVQAIKDKLSNNERIWDKSPWRPKEDGKFPSMTSLTRIIHPTENRDLYIREYAAIMGYPNNFIFYTNECKTPTIQCIAQGVPVNFIKYISKEIMRSFHCTNFYDGDIIYINQTNPKNLKIASYQSIEEFCDANSIFYK